MIEFDLYGAHVRFTGRSGGVSVGNFATLNLGPWTGDDPEAVASNRDRASGGRETAWCRQVHGTQIHRVTTATGEQAAVGDGLLTTMPELALIVMTADCLPIVLATPAAVAVVHAGWRGLVAGVIEQGLRALVACAPGEPIAATIGPGAGRCCYEVGDEVAARFPAAVCNGRQLDLKAAATARLRAAGAARVADVERCTICESDRFFSYRADGPVTGRQGAVVWRT